MSKKAYILFIKYNYIDAKYIETLEGKPKRR